MDKLHRRRVGKGIYRDGYGLQAVVKVGTGDGARQRWKRFPPDTDHATIKAWQDEQRPELRRAVVAPERPTGTLAEDAPGYLSQIAQIGSIKSRTCEVDAWTELCGDLSRSEITAEHIRKARVQWAAAGYAPKTINNRCQTLRHLYHVLDGKHAPSPVDDVDHLPVPETVKVMVPAATFRKVAGNLVDPKTRARFMVIASTGCRPSELKRAEPADVDLRRKVWTVRTGKGGKMRGLYLNADMVAALKAFVAAAAWGTFDASDYAKALYGAGWPRDVRPYQARHSVAIEAGERGVDLGDLSPFMGHSNVQTTRDSYQGVLASRQRKVSDALAGRFAGWKPRSSRRRASTDPIRRLG